MRIHIYIKLHIVVIIDTVEARVTPRDWGWGLHVSKKYGTGRTSGERFFFLLLPGRLLMAPSIHRSWGGGR